MSSPMITATDVVLEYGKGMFRGRRFKALKGVTFQVDQGETLGMIGSNGSGKSSLLRVLAGISKPDGGSVDLHGHNVSLLSMQVGFAPQLTGRENAFLSGMLLGLRKGHVKEHMDQIIDFTGLEEFIDEPLSIYSSGMRARLGFAVALLADPDVLLIDEILGVGDEEFRIKSAEIMTERIKSNKTVVLVSHSLGTLKNLCDRVIWVNEGKIALQGGVEETLAAYSEYVARKRALAVGT